MVLPTPPSNVSINNQSTSDEMATGSTGTILIQANLGRSGDDTVTRLVVVLSANKQFTPSAQYLSGYVKAGSNIALTINGLAQNTLYQGRLYSRNRKNQTSAQFTSISFWTNRPPLAPELQTPLENSQLVAGAAVPFTWKHADPDGEAAQKGFELRTRRAAFPGRPPNAWTTVTQTTATQAYTSPGGQFLGNTLYEWQIRTQDSQGSWGAWSVTNSFFTTGPTTPPRLLSPIDDAAVVVNQPTTFTWNFLSPVSADSQTKADLRYRQFGTTEWVNVTGDASIPGPTGQMTLPASIFAPATRYEWSVRTYNGTSLLSDWAESETFRAINPAGSANVGPLMMDDTVAVASLGQGKHRVFVYDKGGERARGELTPCRLIRWERKRDDISSARVVISSWDADQAAFLDTIEAVQHEMVIFRDNDRVWEGPITLIEDGPGYFAIEAKDVMFWPYRRIMRQGYNDGYQIVNGVQVGLKSVVDRATLITLNCLAYDDPNIIQFITAISYPDDTVQSRVVPDFAKTAWEEIDDLAATAGLDYTVVGRRIIYWDTHRNTGRLPEMGSADFSDPPIITHYGMQLATFFGVSNNAGVYGSAGRLDANGDPLYYGWVEMLASAYGETTGAVTEALTPEARQALEQTLSEQAERNLKGRFPVPKVVRVPDNSTLNPDVQLGINQLVPGVWIPLRATGGIKSLSQVQKLDYMQVEETDKGETIKVTMSPAPTTDEDLDAMGVVVE